MRSASLSFIACGNTHPFALSEPKSYCMRIITLFISLLLATAGSRAQGVLADPGVSQMDITNLAGTSLNANLLPLNQVVQLRIPVFNMHQLNAVPSGSMFWKIGLGSKMVIDPAFVLANAPLSQYFAWQGGMNGGQYEIVGELIAPLPPDFYGDAVFRVKPSVLGTSTITTNLLITNHNTTVTLSDESPMNNFASLQYTVVNSGGPLPVNFTDVKVTRKGCSINVNFFTEGEINVNHYKVEASRDGTNFTVVTELAAQSRNSYSADFALTQALQSASLFIRVKSVDHDGAITYSQTKTVSGTCEKQLVFSIYPNPVAGETLNIKATSGLFNGRYQLQVMDMGGRLLGKKETTINNSAQFSHSVAGLAPGKYILRLSADGETPVSLPFEKF